MFSSHTQFPPKSVFRNFLLVAAAFELFSTIGCGGSAQPKAVASNPAAPGSGSSASGAPAPPPPATPPPPTTPAPAPTPTPAPGAHGPVILVVEENHGYSSAIGSGAMPYLNSLAAQNSLATQYYANTHPSIGNYFMMTAGQIITNDDKIGRAS